ncbi:DegT/DnrJ/EryC1/StrS family aminotransferase [Yersinia frederiksenii]|uniref:DegT/DnrJ/EryC1/StrS family aminotransferase n=1 Tax=Yersinia frederiksenii TaxID=29484 RepID=UPI0005E708C1|nr:DegT/DnrJ/EryC1/StrS family aminotransferase [Yersinia frederiksenii]CFR05123.1 lipopolysaccharide biosynthesis protein RfbH [Yersinia frederiksenii]
MKYSLASKSWNEAEYQAMMSVFSCDNYKMGAICKQFEKEYAAWTGAKYAVFCNSGSSANLLALAAMRYDPRSRNDQRNEIIVPAVSWSTTYYPVTQLGYTLVFADVSAKTFNLSIADVERKITPNTKAILTANLLGNPSDFDALNALCSQHGIVLLEDNCESMGAEYKGKKTGSHGYIGTHSTFFSHHMSTMEGGLCVTDDELTFELMKSLRAHGWVRDIDNKELFYKFFEKPQSELYEFFHFVLPGYNFRPTEIQGALGIEQVKKLDGFIDARIKNAQYFQNALQKLNLNIQLQQEQTNGKSSWFGFGLLCADAKARDDLVQILNDKQVECRPIVSGNMLRQPVFSNFGNPKEFLGAEKIHECGLMIGNHQFSIQSEIDYFINILKTHIVS